MIDWNPIAEKFREADAILIGASNGLSITEGLHLFADNAAFDELLESWYIFHSPLGNGVKDRQQIPSFLGEGVFHP